MSKIKYEKLMGFEAWLSNVGGFIGIFLGYSMIQVSEFFIQIIGFFMDKRHNLLIGMSTN